MKEENKFVKAVAKLIQLTQEGALKWEVVREPEPLRRGPRTWSTWHIMQFMMVGNCVCLN